jgi:ribonucleoside-diphosphate reductase subunit M2
MNTENFDKSRSIIDPLVDVSKKRYCVFPILYEKLFKFYKMAVASFWTVEEVDLSKDRRDFETLTFDEQHFVKTTLGFFAASDGIIMENLSLNFSDEIVVPEVRQFYAIQQAMESIHGEMYSLLIDTIIESPIERQKLFTSIETHDMTKRKAIWAKSWMSRDRPLNERMLAFACVEGIHFSASFACIYWIKRKGIMPGLTFSNELIARDEGLHRDFAIEILKTLQDQVSVEIAHKIVKSAVEVECLFVRNALKQSLLGINMNLMIIYVEFVANHLLGSLGMPKLYLAPDTKSFQENPFPWMESISLQGKTNFFEKRVGDYQKANVMNSLTTQLGHEFETDIDF